MENISKTEFEEMGAKYPLAYQNFHNWIDSYKASVNWNKMLGHATDEEIKKYAELPFLTIKGEIKGFDHTESGSIIVMHDNDSEPKVEYITPIFPPKFHELVFEMQFGILAKFMTEVHRDNLILLQLDKETFLKKLRYTYHILEKRLQILEQRQEQELKQQ